MRFCVKVRFKIFINSSALHESRPIWYISQKKFILTLLYFIFRAIDVMKIMNNDMFGAEQ